MGWIGALAGIASAALQVGGQFGGAAMSKEAGAGASKTARKWQTNMADTAHQREMADLAAAGLNPILTATGGSGAGMGSVGAAATPDYGDLGIGRGLGSAREYSMLKDAQRGVKADADKSEADAATAKHTTNIAKVADDFAVQKMIADVNATGAGALMANQGAIKAAADAGVSNAQREYIDVNKRGAEYDLSKKRAQGMLWNQGADALDKSISVLKNPENWKRAGGDLMQRYREGEALLKSGFDWFKKRSAQ